MTWYELLIALIGAGGIGGFIATIAGVIQNRRKSVTAPPRKAKINNYKIMRKIIDLYPEAPNEWVYRDHDDDLLPDGTPRRQFEPSVTIPLSDLDLWHECTDQQRRYWEEQHPDPSPEPSGESSEPSNEGKEAKV